MKLCSHGGSQRRTHTTISALYGDPFWAVEVSWIVCYSVRTRMRSMLDPFDAFPLWDYTPRSVFAKDAQAVAKTRVDWWESHDAHYIKADLPEGWGCFLTRTTKDDVEVLFENDRVLQISGRTSSLGQGRMRLGERCRVSCLRRLRLPANSDASAISAELENGVLTVTIPKRTRTPTSSEEQKNVRVVEIQET